MEWKPKWWLKENLNKHPVIRTIKMTETILRKHWLDVPGVCSVCINRSDQHFLKQTQVHTVRSAGCARLTDFRAALIKGTKDHRSVKHQTADTQSEHCLVIPHLQRRSFLPWLQLRNIFPVKSSLCWVRGFFRSGYRVTASTPQQHPSTKRQRLDFDSSSQDFNSGCRSTEDTSFYNNMNKMGPFPLIFATVVWQMTAQNERCFDATVSDYSSEQQRQWCLYYQPLMRVKGPVQLYRCLSALLHLPP